MLRKLKHSSQSSTGSEPASNPKKTTPTPTPTPTELSVSDFFDLSKPWVLVPNGSFRGFFDFVPANLRLGPWSPVATVSIIAVLYLVIMEGIKMNQAGGILRFFVEESITSSNEQQHDYQAFNREWYLTLAGFLWMLFVCWDVVFNSTLGSGAWVAFTLWSWTIVTVRFGLGVLAPFAEVARLPLDVLRFPALLSATITFFLWNFVLLPVIVFFIKDKEKRSNFLSYMTTFRLTQLHVFNIFFAAANGVFSGPKRQLHMGDAAAAAVLMVVYILWYYCFLDRIGVHLYPIFSPRTPFAVGFYALLFGSAKLTWIPIFDSFDFETEKISPDDFEQQQQNIQIYRRNPKLVKQQAHLVQYSMGIRGPERIPGNPEPGNNRISDDKQIPINKMAEINNNHKVRPAILPAIPISMKESSKSSFGREARDQHRQKLAKSIENLSVFDLFNPSKPWVLVPNGSLMGVFDFVPAYLRQGPWSPVAVFSIGTILYALGSEALKMQRNGGMLGYFESSVDHDDEYYTAFDKEWLFTLVCFCWTVYICWYTYANGPNGKAAWATFTLWSWTILTIRHAYMLWYYLVMDRIGDLRAENNNNTNTPVGNNHNNNMSAYFMFTVIVVCIPMFLFGVNTGVLNAPESVIFPSHSVLAWSVAVSAFCVGGFCGANVSGRCSDYYGRRACLIFILLGNFVFGILHSVAPNMTVLSIARLGVGIAGGASTVLTPMMLAEIAPPAIRGTIGTLTQLSCVLGILASILWALPFCTLDKWRTIFIPIPIISLIGLLASPFCLPESPKWLLLKYYETRGQEARDTMLSFRSVSNPSDEEEVEMEVLLLLGEQGRPTPATALVASGDPSQPQSGGEIPTFSYMSTSSMDSDDGNSESLASAEEGDEEMAQDTSFRSYASDPRNRIPLASAILFPVAQQLSGINAVFYYSTSFFEGVIPNPQTGTIIAFSVNVLATLVALSLMDRLGRKTLLSCSAGGMFVCCVLLTFSLLGTLPGYVTVVAVMLYLTFFEIGLGCIPFFLASEMIAPAHLGTVQSISMSSNWFSNFCVGILFPYMDRSLGAYSFVPFAVVLLATLLYSILVLPETRGKTLQQVMQELDGSRQQQHTIVATTTLEEDEAAAAAAAEGERPVASSRQRSSLEAETALV
eukprot:scaffold2141_cov120-Cylindrotheca_fusiformis.AAC.23